MTKEEIRKEIEDCLRVHGVSGNKGELFEPTVDDLVKLYLQLFRHELKEIIAKL